jgi:hypothetical protein
LDHAITATQKTILKAFGMDAAYIKHKATEISDCLNAAGRIKETGRQERRDEKK